MKKICEGCKEWYETYQYFNDENFYINESDRLCLKCKEKFKKELNMTTPITDKDAIKILRELKEMFCDDTEIGIKNRTAIDIAIAKLEGKTYGKL